jgi:hypothetical protein
MNGQPKMMTVFRTMDRDAKQACETVADALAANGLSPLILDDKALGVPEGVCEVRVPEDQQERAEQVLATPQASDPVEAGDPSAGLDLSEPIFQSEGSSTAEFEATAIKALLEANDIPAHVGGDTVLPNLPFEVRVARKDVERARELIEEFTVSGPEAAAQAELEGEEAARTAEGLESKKA